MVGSTLDNDNKPVLGPVPYRNYGIAHWFRGWDTYLNGKYSKGTNMAPVYTPTPGIKQDYNNEWEANVVYEGDKNVGQDTSFKNVVIPGKLTFTLANRNTGTYRFEKRGNNGFFPLDNATVPANFGKEWTKETPNTHNFSFTMEFVLDFQAKANMSFRFSGDDDVWVFIDKTLALDLGGIHSEMEKSFNLDNVPVPGGIVYGKTYTLRVFYAERHSSASNIMIETNIVAPPTGVGISTVGNNGGGIVSGGGSVTKSADDSLTLWSVVYGDNDVPRRPGDEYRCEDVTWKINGVVVGTGCSIKVKDSIARAEGVKIEVTYKGPDGTLSGSTNMIVTALAPAFICIQTSETPKPSSTNRGTITDPVEFGGKDETTVYAVLRDKYGNFAGYAERKACNNPNDWCTADGWTDAQWHSEDTDVATISPSTGKSTVVRKEFMGEGTVGYLTVEYRVCGAGPNGRECVTLYDTTTVGSKSEGNMAIGPNPFTPGPNGPSLSESLGSKVVDFYQKAVDAAGGPGGKGVLIAVDAPNPLKEGPFKDAKGNKRFGKIMIYDAVGNVVRTEALYNSNRRSSYGFVWDGKNAKGRFVGPGTYLVRVTGTVDDASSSQFKFQRMVGVKK